MLKKIFFTIILFMCVSVVQAKSYTTYKHSDEVTVNLNDTLQRKFYVIKNNDTSIIAIDKDALGDLFYFSPSGPSLSGSAAETRLNDLTKDWSNPTTIRLVDISEIDDSATIDNDYEKEIHNSIFHIGKSYWTQSVAANGEQYYPFVVSNWASYSNLHSTQDESPVNGGAIRPVIEISKDFVVGGTYVSADDTLWQNYVEKFKKTEDLKAFEAELNITSTDNSLTITMTDDGKNYETKFKFNNGILELIPSESDEQSFIDMFMIKNALNALVYLKGYDLEKAQKWSKQDKKFTLADDGLEYEEKEITIEEGNSSVKYTKFTMFKLDLRNGFKSFANFKEPEKESTPVKENAKVEKKVDNSKKEENVKNPTTGDNNVIIGIVLCVVLIGVYRVFIYPKKHNKFLKI